MPSIQKIDCLPDGGLSVTVYYQELPKSENITFRTDDDGHISWIYFYPPSTQQQCYYQFVNLEYGTTNYFSQYRSENEKKQEDDITDIISITAKMHSVGATTGQEVEQVLADGGDDLLRLLSLQELPDTSGNETQIYATERFTPCKVEGEFGLEEVYMREMSYIWSDDSGFVTGVDSPKIASDHNHFLAQSKWIMIRINIPQLN